MPPFAHAWLTRGRGHSVGKQLVNSPSFLVRTDSERHIEHDINSPFGDGRKGRVARKHEKSKGAKEEAADE